MFIPRAFEKSDLPSIFHLVESQSFATLVTQSDSDIVASHLPLLLQPGEGPFGTLYGHMAKANEQWKNVTTHDALAIFHGPHSYISARWYSEPATVPTWNYVAVHGYGPIELIADEDATIALMHEMATKYEPAPDGWRFDESNVVLRRMLPGVLAFRIPVRRWEGKWKLSQNHSPDRRRRLVEGLRIEGGPEGESIADLMNETL